jgi:hypothetical protein
MRHAHAASDILMRAHLVPETWTQILSRFGFSFSAAPCGAWSLERKTRQYTRERSELMCRVRGGSREQRIRTNDPHARRAGVRDVMLLALRHH